MLAEIRFRIGARLLVGTFGWSEAFASKASFVLEWLFPAIGTYCLVARPLNLLGDFGIVSIIRNSAGTFSNKSIEKGQWGAMLCIQWPISAQDFNTERKTRISYRQYAHELAKGYEDPKP
jgi:hypothetical protein